MTNPLCLRYWIADCTGLRRCGLSRGALAAILPHFIPMMRP